MKRLLRGGIIHQGGSFLSLPACLSLYVSCPAFGPFPLGDVCPRLSSLPTRGTFSGSGLGGLVSLFLTFCRIFLCLWSSLYVTVLFWTGDDFSVLRPLRNFCRGFSGLFSLFLFRAFLEFAAVLGVVKNG